MTARRGTSAAGRRARAVGAVALLSVTLAACSVEVVQDDPVGSDAGTTDGDTAGGDPTSQGTEAADDTAPPRRTVGRDDAGAALLDRATLGPRTTQHLTCEGGDLRVENAAVAVVVGDACGTLTVDGAGALVVAGDVERLAVSASSVRVVVASVSSVDLDAADVRVAWEDGDPAVRDGGAGNAYGPVGTVELGLPEPGVPDPGTDAAEGGAGTAGSDR